LILSLFLILYSFKSMQFLMFVQVQDISPFSYGLESDKVRISDRPDGVLFPKGHPIPSTVVFQFKPTDLSHLEAFYANEHELPPGTFPKISSFTVCSV